MQPAALEKPVFDSVCHDLESYRHTFDKKIFLLKQKDGYIPATFRTKFFNTSSQDEKVAEFILNFFETHEKHLERKHFSVLTEMSTLSSNPNYKNRYFQLIEGLFREDVIPFEEIQKKIALITSKYIQAWKDKDIHLVIENIMSPRLGEEEDAFYYLVTKFKKIKVKKELLKNSELIRKLEKVLKETGKKENYCEVNLQVFSTKIIECFSKILLDNDLLKNLDKEILFELYDLLFFLEEPYLKDKIAEALKDKLTAYSALSLIIKEYRRFSSDEPLLQVAIEKVARGFYSISSESEFLRLPQPILLKIVRREDLDIFSEECLFQDLMKWARVQRGYREEFLLQEVKGECILGQIRFEQMENPKNLLPRLRRHLYMPFLHTDEKREERTSRTQATRKMEEGKIKFLKSYEIHVPSLEKGGKKFEWSYFHQGAFHEIFFIIDFRGVEVRRPRNMAQCEIYYAFLGSEVRGKVSSFDAIAEKRESQVIEKYTSPKYREGMDTEMNSLKKDKSYLYLKFEIFA